MYFTLCIANLLPPRNFLGVGQLLLSTLVPPALPSREKFGWLFLVSVAGGFFLGVAAWVDARYRFTV